MPELELGSSQPSYILGVVPLQDNPTTMLIGQLGCRSTVHDIITISTVVPAPLPTPTSATTQTVPYDVGVYHGWLPLSHSSRCRFCVLGACSRIEPEFRDIRMHGLRGEETTVVKWEERQLYRKEQEGYLARTGAGAIVSHPSSIAAFGPGDMYNLSAWAWAYEYLLHRAGRST